MKGKAEGNEILKTAGAQTPAASPFEQIPPALVALEKGKTEFKPG